jgi:hypothetical protein
LGKLKPQHRFFLNPYPDIRFTRCPDCERMMKKRKRPFVVHVDPHILLTLNMTAQYCPACDLIILHQDHVEALLYHAIAPAMPDSLGRDFLVLGTLERAAWQQRPQDMEFLLANLHDFKEVLIYTPAHYGWGPAPERKKTPPDAG